MARIKSIVIRIEVNQAKKAHNCQASVEHRIQSGDSRLNVRKGRNWDRYCVSCAKTILERGIAELQELQQKFQTF